MIQEVNLQPKGDEVYLQEWASGRSQLRDQSLPGPSFVLRDDMSSPGKRKERLTQRCQIRLNRIQCSPLKGLMSEGIPAYAVAATFFIVSSSSASRPSVIFSSSCATKQGVASPFRYQNISQSSLREANQYKYQHLFCNIIRIFYHLPTELTPF